MIWTSWYGVPLHTDPHHDILCQVVGKVYVKIHIPVESPRLHPRGIQEDGVDMSHASEVDVEAAAEILEKGFPLLQESERVETILNVGEFLYIPVGW